MSAEHAISPAQHAMVRSAVVSLLHAADEAGGLIASEGGGEAETFAMTLLTHAYALGIARVIGPRAETDLVVRTIRHAQEMLAQDVPAYLIELAMEAQRRKEAVQ